jgi:serine/threonine-protein kinase
MEPTTRTAAGDQYSLGCTLYYFLTGRYPFPEGSAVEKMMAHQYKQPTAIKDLEPDVPDELIEIVERLMQKTPEARYASTEEVVEALRPLAASRAPLKAQVAKTSKTGARGAPDNGQTATAKPTAGSAPGAAPSPLRKKPSAQGISGGKGGLRESMGAAKAPPPPPVRELPPEDEEEVEDEEISDEEEEEEEEEEEYEEGGEASPMMKVLLVVLVLAILGLIFWWAKSLF